MVNLCTKCLMTPVLGPILTTNNCLNSHCSALAATVAAVPALAGLVPAARADDAQGVASSRMSYSRFLEYLDMGRVKKVNFQPFCSVRSFLWWLILQTIFVGAFLILSPIECAVKPLTYMLSSCLFTPLQVDLFENGTIAIVEAVSPELGNRVQRVRVQLPGTSQELLQKFREKKVDFAAHSNTEVCAHIMRYGQQACVTHKTILTPFLEHQQRIL